MGEVAGKFFGTHTMTIDDKGRLTVPSSFRKILGEEIVLRKCRADHSIEILSPQCFDLFLEKLKSLPEFDVDVRQLRVLEAANAVTTVIDKQGRVLIPSDMKLFAGIVGPQAVVTGSIDSVKVWEPETWAAYQSEWEKGDLVSRVYEKFKS